MKNFILKYKIKLLAMLFFTFSLVFLNNNVFASDVTTYVKKCQSCDIAFENSIYDISTISNSSSGKHLTNIIIVEHNDNIYAIAYFSQNSSSHNNNMYLKTYKGITYPYVEGIYNTDIHLYNGTSFVYQGWDGANFDVNGYSSIINNCNIIYSSSDIYTDDSCGDIFFPLPPQTLVEVMEKVKKGATLQEIVALLPVILSVLVSLLALRKALKMLSDFLRTS